jgi:CDP-diacylglycerol--glycerol-3-phosphate 3-phosphatidyltransferase
MNQLLDAIKKLVQGVMTDVARLLNRLSGGKLRPNTVTMIGLLMHLPIAWLIAIQHNLVAAILLVIFGLFDSLDGALARLQNRASNAGMLLDATTDRMKEVLLYTGAAYAIVAQGRPYLAVWAVVACGGSLLVSYVKARGETVVAGKLSATEINKLDRNGLMRFEVRMFVLVVGLLSNHRTLAVILIAITSWMTAIGRLNKIMKRLR